MREPSFNPHVEHCPQSGIEHHGDSHGNSAILPESQSGGTPWPTKSSEAAKKSASRRKRSRSPPRTRRLFQRHRTRVAERNPHSRATITSSAVVAAVLSIAKGRSDCTPRQYLSSPIC